MSLPRAPSSMSRKQRLGWSSSSPFLHLEEDDAANGNGNGHTSSSNTSPLLLRRSSSNSPRSNSPRNSPKAVGMRQTRLFLRWFVLPTLAVSVVYLQLHSLGVVLHPDDTTSGVQVDMAAPQGMTGGKTNITTTTTTTNKSTSTNPFAHGTTPLHKWEETRLREVFQQIHPEEERRLQSHSATATGSPPLDSNLDQARDAVVEELQQQFGAIPQQRYKNSMSLHKFQQPSHIKVSDNSSSKNHTKPHKKEETLPKDPTSASYKAKLRARFQSALIQGHANQAANAKLNAKIHFGSASKRTKQPAPVRKRPTHKVLYFVHIHKSGGTILCSLAHHNQLTVNRQYNCNVQTNQRCCGEDDSTEMQTHYAQQTPYDLVAAETQMYSGMDATHYNYIVVLRQSVQRYFSHWKHILRDLPPKRVRRMTPQLTNSKGKLVGSRTSTTTTSLLSANSVKRLAAHRTGTSNRAPSKAPRKLLEKEDITNDKDDTTNDNNKDTEKDPLDSKDDTVTTKGGDEEEEEEEEEKHSDSKDGGGGDHNTTSIPATTESWTERIKSTLFGTNTKKVKTTTNKRQPKKLEHPAQLLPLPKKHKPSAGTNFSEWWQGQPDNWNARQICGTKCMGVPKYQLSQEHWNYILDRFLQFHTILFLEDLQGSVEVLAERLHWNQTNMTAVTEADKFEREEKKRKADEKKKKGSYRRVSTTKPRTATAYATEPPLQAPNTSVAFADWDPLMSALDDALYDIGRRWERLKQEQKWPLPTLELQLQESAMAPKTTTLMENLTDHENLPEPLRQHFEHYFQDEPNNHRHQCEYECCNYICSKW